MAAMAVMASVAVAGPELAAASDERASPTASASAAPSAPSVPPAQVVPSHVSVLTGEQVVQILDETVDWYRTLGTQQQTATQPSDLLILYANQQTASQVVALAFEIARANAELLSSEASSAAPAGGDADAGDGARSEQTLAGMQKKLQAQRQSIQAEMDAERRQLAAAPKGGATELDVKVQELQSELDMVDARRNLLNNMTQFLNESDAKTAGANALKAHIDAIAASVPSSGVAAAPAAPAASAAAPPAAAAPGGKAAAAAAPALFAGNGAAATRLGIWDLGANVLRLSQKNRDHRRRRPPHGCAGGRRFSPFAASRCSNCSS